VSDVFEGVVRESRSFFRAAAIKAARDLGLFVSPPAGVKPRRLSKLLAFLERENLRASDEPSVTVDGPWGRLAEAIRTDAPIPDASGSLDRFHSHLWDVGGEAARALWSTVQEGGSLLDAGAGSGVYAGAWLDRDPSNVATLIDRAVVLAIARRRLHRHGIRARFADIDLAGEAPLPGPSNVALLANLLHLHDGATCARIVARVVSALAPDGLVIVKDLDPDSDAGVLFALNMALCTEGGDVWAPETIAGWLRAAGARDVTVARGEGASLTVRGVRA
jgi:hypothetical protein